MTTHKVKVTKRHRSAASGQFVDSGTAKKSPDKTIAETVKLPNIRVAFNVWDRDLKNMLRQMSQEGVIIGLACQPDGRYTIAVERAK